MIPVAFDYTRAESVDAALAALDSQHARLQAALLTPADGCLLWDPAGRLQLAQLPAQSDAAAPASLDDLAKLLKPEDAGTATAARTPFACSRVPSSTYGASASSTACLAAAAASGNRFSPRSRCASSSASVTARCARRTRSRRLPSSHR